MVLDWLVNVPPPLMLYSRLFPAFKVPVDRPVAAKKLPCCHVLERDAHVPRGCIGKFETVIEPSRK